MLINLVNQANSEQILYTLVCYCSIDLGL